MYKILEPSLAANVLLFFVKLGFFLYTVFIMLHRQILVFLIFLQKSIFFFFEEESYCSGGIPRCHIRGLKLLFIVIVCPPLSDLTYRVMLWKGLYRENDCSIKVSAL